jgi:hypothetical protein
LTQIIAINAEKRIITVVSRKTHFFAENRYHIIYPGIDVMITIFGDLRQFSAKSWRFSQKPMS